MPTRVLTKSSKVMEGGRSKELRKIQPAGVLYEVEGMESVL